MSTAERASERSVKALVLLAFMLGLREGEDQLSTGRLIGWTLGGRAAQFWHPGPCDLLVLNCDKT